MGCCNKVSMNFDQRVDRSATSSVKWENRHNDGLHPDIIPLWVADMDFSPPTAVVEALQERAAHPIYGYTAVPPDYFTRVSAWYGRRHGLALNEDEILFAPSVLSGISLALRELTQPGDGVLLFSPIYYPFFSLIPNNSRELVTYSLSQDGEGRYRFDLEALDRTIETARRAGHPVRALVLANPHNPGGRVWSAEELRSLVELSRRYDFFILSDEIHGDLAFEPHRYVSVLSAAAPDLERVAVFTGPNKTFNLAGLQISHVFCPYPPLRQRLESALKAAYLEEPNLFALTASYAAYASGDQWLDELLAYLRGNIELLESFCRSDLPGLKPLRPEGTYLVWADCLGLLETTKTVESRALSRYLEREARVRFSPGLDFGPEGAAYLRINVACPRSLLEEALSRVARLPH